MPCDIHDSLFFIITNSHGQWIITAPSNSIGFIFILNLEALHHLDSTITWQKLQTHQLYTLLTMGLVLRLAAVLWLMWDGGAENHRNALPWKNSDFLLTEGKLLFSPKILSKWKANTSLMSRGLLMMPQCPWLQAVPVVPGPLSNTTRTALWEGSSWMLSIRESANIRMLRMSSLLSHEGELSL